MGHPARDIFDGIKPAVYVGDFGGSFGMQGKADARRDAKAWQTAADKDREIRSLREHAMPQAVVELADVDAVLDQLDPRKLDPAARLLLTAIIAQMDRD